MVLLKLALIVVGALLMAAEQVRATLSRSGSPGKWRKPLPGRPVGLGAHRELNVTKLAERVQAH